MTTKFLVLVFHHIIWVSEDKQLHTNGTCFIKEKCKLSTFLSFISTMHILLGCVMSHNLQYGCFHYSPFADIQTQITSLFPDVFDHTYMKISGFASSIQLTL